MTSSKDVMAWLNAKIGRLDKGSMDALSEAMEAGENITKHNIETRGTEGTGKRGRVETGKMRDSVGSEAKRTGLGRAEGRFGWLQKGPYYTPYQEEGTKNIEPMYALSDAAEEVQQDYIRHMDNVVKDA